MRPRRTDGAPIAIVLLLFYLSGALALVYELVWSRLMMHVFGSTALAVGTVLAAFMFGMAVGAWRIGKIADRTSNCLRLYAWLEIGIAVSAFISHLLLSQAGPAHQSVYQFVGDSPTLFAIVRFGLAFLLVLAPTVLMGATLPVLTRFLMNRHALVGINLSTLYSINTLGAVTGVLLTGFFLIGRYGVHLPVYLAVAGNLLIGCIAWIASRRIGNVAVDSTPTPAANQSGGMKRGEVTDPVTYRIVLFGLGLSGMTSFAYEIYWTRSLVFILGNSTYALTTMLSAFLTGIALGGYLVRFPLRHSRDRAAVFGWLQISLGVFSALALPILFFIADPRVLDQYLLKTSANALPLLFAGFGLSFLVMLVPATLIGATFPLVGQIAVRDTRVTGSSVGRIYAINTIGNVLGALLPGLILLTWLGIQKGILAMAALNVSIGFLIVSLRMLRPPARPIWRLALPLALVASVVLMSRAPVHFQFPSDGEQDYYETFFYREGPLATTKVYLNPRTNEKHMSVDGIVIGGTGYTEYKQLLLAHLPKLLIEDVSSELSVGVGSGILLGESARHSRVREITGVEIEPSVIDGAQWFAEENSGVLENPLLSVVIDDIGSFLRTTSGAYQVVSADEKTADEYASNGFSYSQDYYRLLLNHLAPGGLVAQWVPATLPTKQFRMVLKTFTASFPHVQLWYFLPAHERGPFNAILIGSVERIPLRFDSIRRRFLQQPQAWESLVPYGLTSAEAVLPHYVADETVLLPALEDVPVNSLEYPRYEFFYPWDYARQREAQVIANHEMIIEFKRAAFRGLVAKMELNPQESIRFRQTMAAEFRYLAGFQKFLEGTTIAEQYRMFDEALALAPWNDSLRARIFAQYSYLASTHRDPADRARLMQRADNLYR